MFLKGIILQSGGMKVFQSSREIVSFLKVSMWWCRRFHLSCQVIVLFKSLQWVFRQISSLQWILRCLSKGFV